jgi:hypothetical protein
MARSALPNRDSLKQSKCLEKGDRPILLRFLCGFLMAGAIALPSDFLKMPKLIFPPDGLQVPGRLPKLILSPRPPVLAKAPAVCSIPLLEYRVTPKIDPMIQPRNFHSNPIDRMSVPNPAPVCRDWNGKDGH